MPPKPHRIGETLPARRLPSRTFVVKHAEGCGRCGHGCAASSEVPAFAGFVCDVHGHLHVEKLRVKQGSHYYHDSIASHAATNPQRRAHP